MNCFGHQLKRVYKYVVVAILIGFGAQSDILISSQQDEYKVLCLTRHSARGIEFINAQEIPLPDNILLPNPLFTWNETLSEAGADLINAQAINACVQKGLKVLHLGKWTKKWEEIRVDLLNQRTFLTGKILKKKLHDPNILLTAVINKKEPLKKYSYRGNDYDSVSFSMNPGTFDTDVPFTPTNIDTTIFQEKTRLFLNQLNLSINHKPFTGELPPVFKGGKLSSFYADLIDIATDLVVMAAHPKPPLNYLFKSNHHYPLQKEIVESAANLLNYKETNQYSNEWCVYDSLPIIEYLNGMTFNNKGKIVITHEERQYRFLRSMNIDSNPFDIPFQSYIIIQTKDQVCIMYTAPRVEKNGVLSSSSFITQLIWKGSIEEWNVKIRDMRQYIDPRIPPYAVLPAYELKIN